MVGRVLLAVGFLLVSGSARAQAPTQAPAIADQNPPVAELPTIPETLPDLSTFEGKNVVAAHAKLEGLIWNTPPKLLGPKISAPFTVASARAELARLLEGGGFAAGSLEVQAVAGGVEVIFRLQPARFVRRVVVRGGVFAEDDVRRAGGLTDVRDVTEKSLNISSRKIREYYVRRGFPTARVEIATIETDLPLVVVAQVTIEPGEPTLIERRVFSGLPMWDQTAVAAAQKYTVITGDRADNDALEEADSKLTSVLRGSGFPNAVAAHALTPGATSGVVLTINVVPGPKVVPSFEGNTVFDGIQLLSILDLKGEADRSPLRLASKIETAYRRRGYFDVLVESELLGAATDQQRTLASI